MARNRASMREGPLAELFRATEAAQRQQEQEGEPAAQASPAEEPQEKTVEHVPVFADEPREPQATPVATTAPAPVEREPAHAPEPEVELSLIHI